MGHCIENRKSPQWCLTPKHSRNSQQRMRHHWGIVSQTENRPSGVSPRTIPETVNKRRDSIAYIVYSAYSTTAYTAYTAYDIQRIDRIQCVQRMQRIQRIQHVQRIQHMQEHCMQRTQHIQNVRRIRAPHSVYSMYTSHICYIQHKHHCATQASRGPPLRPNCAENIYITMVLLIFRFATTN